jgi:hypothetical protein
MMAFLLWAKANWRLLAAGAVVLGVLWLRAYVIGLQRQVAADKETMAGQRAALAAYDRALGQFGQAIITNRNTAASEAGQTSAFWRGQCKTAFEAGYASGQGHSGGAAGLAPDGVSDDLRTVWAKGAFQPPAGSAGGVPAKPGDAAHR